MCVILVCPTKVRPSREILDACHQANPHGAGVAWRDGGKVKWFKDLNPEELARLLPLLPGEIVIHFRLASVGGVDPKLCHPFPITPQATVRRSGQARAVLFHNGTWGGWRETYRAMPRHCLSSGPLSDSRVAAALVELNGMDVLDDLPGRYVVFDRDFTELFGDWQRWQGMKVSNRHFTHHLRRPQDWISSTQGQFPEFSED